MDRAKAKISRITGIFTVITAISAAVGYGLYCYIRYTLLHWQVIYIDGIETVFALLALAGILAGLKALQSGDAEGKRDKLILISFGSLLAAVASPVVTALITGMFRSIDIIRVCYIIISVLIVISETAGVISLYIKRKNSVD